MKYLVFWRIYVPLYTLLAILVAVLWHRSGRKIGITFCAVAAGLGVVLFMPAVWLFGPALHRLLEQLF